MWEAGSIQCNYISPRSVFLAILTGSFFWKDGNIGRRGVQWVKYRQELMCHLGAHMRCHTRPAGRLTGLGRLRHPCGVAFFQCSTHTNAFQKNSAGSDVCSYNTVWKLFSSLLPHSCSQPLCSMACSCGHLWPIVISANQSRLVESL